MYITRKKHRASIAAPILAASLLLAACGGDGDSGNTEDADTTATGTGTTSATADDTATTDGDDGSANAESTEGAGGAPPEQDAEGIELTITKAGPSETMSDASAVGFEWAVAPGPTGTCDFMVTIYDQSGQILSATPGTACESQLQLDFMGYDVEEFTVALESGGQTAVKKKAVEG